MMRLSAFVAACLLAGCNDNLDEIISGRWYVCDGKSSQTIELHQDGRAFVQGMTCPKKTTLTGQKWALLPGNRLEISGKCLVHGFASSVPVEFSTILNIASHDEQHLRINNVEILSSGTIERDSKAFQLSRSCDPQFLGF